MSKKFSRQQLSPRRWASKRLLAFLSGSSVFVTIAVYCAVVIAVVSWSGSTVEKTLYDKYIIYLEGAILPVADDQAAGAFYRDVLNFIEVPADEFGPAGSHAFLFTPKKKLFLQEAAPVQNKNRAFGEGPVLLVRVRNGFRQLHAELTKRTKTAQQDVAPHLALEQILPSHVSQIYVSQRGDEFVISDPDHNRIIFYQQPRIFFPSRQ